MKPRARAPNGQDDAGHVTPARWLSSSTSLGLFVALAVLHAAPSAATPLLVALGDLAGGPHRSTAHAVSADGSTVVGESYTASGREAFRWTMETGMTGLGELPGGPHLSRALGVSADGSVVVGYGHPDSGREAFRWTASTGMVGLGDLTASSQYSEARDVSADGNVIVGIGSSVGPGGFPITEASRWTAADGMAGLGLFPGTGAAVNNASHAHAVSADGSTIVGYGYSPSIQLFDAFQWNEATGMATLVADPLRTPLNVAHDVSADGGVVVGYVEGTAANEPFRWTASTGLVRLGGLPGGTARGEALATSADGSVVVGFAFSSSGSREAFLWDATRGMRSLESFLSDEYGLDVAAWRLDEATGISADGRVIVGSGRTAAGTLEGWMVVLPEPASAVLLGSGLVALGFGRRRP